MRRYSIIMLGALLILCAHAFPVGAQVPTNPVDPTVDSPAGGLGLEPGEARQRLPSPLESAKGDDRESLELPPIELPEGSTPRLGAGLGMHVERFVVEGSSVFTAHELEKVLTPWTGRRIESEELLDARDALTRLYVDSGYATSGAIVPDQDVKGGVIHFSVIEGAIASIQVRGNRRFRDLYFRTRLANVARAPVHVGEIEAALRVLQRDEWIERVDALIEPGTQLGVSQLVVDVTERPQWRIGAEGGNDRSPAIGSAGGVLEGRVANLLGLGDVMSARFQGTKGLLDFEGRIEMPITPWDTRLRVRARITETELQEAPFDQLEIESSARSYGVSVLHPLRRSESNDLWLELTGEWRQTESTILGRAFCFELQTQGCSRPRVAALRAGLQWTFRSAQDVVAARTLFSFGLDALSATTGGPDSAADGEFFAWLGQAQWAHIFADVGLNPQLLFRADVQLADDPLLSMEKIAVGGRRSVRGYRENQLVRDNAAILSGELRVPILRDSLHRPIVEVVPFMDWGRAWNHGARSQADNLWSVGTGMRLSLRHGVLGEVYWGGRLADVSNPHDFLQDYGVHMRLRIDAPQFP